MRTERRVVRRGLRLQGRRRLLEMRARRRRMMAYVSCAAACLMTFGHFLLYGYW
jgi:hypothetical protein